MMFSKFYPKYSLSYISPWYNSNRLPLSTCPVLDTKDEGLGNKRGHVFSQRWKFKDVESSSKHLLNQVIYHEDGVVAINKPPDLGSSKDACSIYHSLPYLAEKLGYKYLKLVSVPEKSVSGVTILAADASIAHRIGKALRRSKSVFTHEPRQKFLAVTVGHPLIEDGLQRYGITKQYKEKEKHIFILRTWGQNAVKRREINIGTVGHRTLARSEFVSLVSVSTWLTQNHCPRVYLSDVLLSPALGDLKFGPRVSSLFNKPILLKPWVAPAVQALPLPLLQKLHMRNGAEHLMPLHFHLHELNLHRFLSNDADLILRAEPPDFFKWTCDQFDLELPERFEEGQQNTEVAKEESNHQETDLNNTVKHNSALNPS